MRNGGKGQGTVDGLVILIAFWGRTNWRLPFKREALDFPPNHLLWEDQWGSASSKGSNGSQQVWSLESLLLGFWEVPNR